MSLGRRSEISKRRGDIAQGASWRNPYGFLFARDSNSSAGKGGIVLASILAGVWCIGLAYMLTYIPWIQLKNISIKTEADADTNARVIHAIDLAMRKLDRNSLRNAYLLKTSHIIDLVEQPPAYVLGSTQRLALFLTHTDFPCVVSINDALYASRSDGTLIGRINAQTATDMSSKTFIELQGEYEQSRDGNQAIDTGVLTDIEHIRSKNQGFTSFRVVRGVPRFIVAMHSDGWYSYIDRDTNIDEQLTRVQLFIASSAAKDRRWEYVDPRFGGKVFFRPL